MLTDNITAPLILIVEDDDSHADLINRAFAGAQEEFRLEIVSSLRDAKTAVEGRQPTLVLTDFRLPDGEGLELVLFPDRYWPVVLMTSQGNEQVAVDAMKAGAMDYLVKTPESLASLPRIVHRSLREWELVHNRIRSEEILRKTEARQRAMIENIVDVIAILDQDGINKFNSPNIEKWFGWRAKDVVGSSCWANVHPDDLEATRKVFEDLLCQPSAENTAECRFRCKDGSYKWIVFTAVNLVHDPDIAGVLLSFHDITERKHAQEMIQKRIVSLTQPLENATITFEELFDLADIQRIQDGFALATGVASLITQPDGTPITAPSNFTYLCSELIRKSETGRANCAKSDAQLGCRHPDGPVVQTCLSGGLWDAGASITVGDRHIANWLIGQVRDESQNEEQICEYARVIGVDETAFRDAFQKVPAMSLARFKQIAEALFILANQLSTAAYQNVLQARYITERKRSEDERRQLEQQFHHAQKMESLGVLSGGIAHDFNNILTVILGHCYMAREGLEPEQSHEACFRKIETAANRAADLCRQMLTYAGKNTAVQKNINLSQLVDEVVKMLYAAIMKNVTIELNLNGDNHQVWGDSSQIEQIVMNLTINAAEAIGDANGTVRIELSTLLVEADVAESDAFGTPVQPGSYVCLEVSDTGCGMDEETRKRIFEPFYTTKFTGRGLGMSAVLGIIKAHNGLLRMTSAPGAGTTFKVWLPVAPTSEVSVAAPDTTARHISTAMGTVLLVDDEQILREMGTTLLEALGFSVLTAQHGREALEMYGRCGSDIDVVMLDLIMPVMGGIETYHELRKAAPSLPIIICSGYGYESVEGVINNDPHANFLCKPYKPDQLGKLLTEMMTAGNS